jgi:hypothetical protein
VSAGTGGTVGFSVFAASTTNLAYQWYLNDWLAVPGATNTTLTLTNVSYLNLGNYSVEISSAAGAVVDSLEAALEIGPAGNSYDKLEDLLDNWAGLGGGSPHFKPLLASVSFPSVSIGTIGSQLINNFNSTTEQGEPVQVATVGGASRWYMLSATTNATLEVDTLGSDIATLMSVYTGTNIFTLSLVTSNKNGAVDGVHSQVKFPTGPTNYLIQVDGVNGAQGNIYVNWRMGVPPNIVSNTQSLIASPGGSFVLNAGVSNNVTAPAYQWQQNGLNLPGATNATLNLSQFQFNQVGSYSVTVSNLVGAVVNAIAKVNAQTPLVLGQKTNGFQLSGSSTQAVVVQMSTNLTSWNPVFTNSSPLLPVSYLDTNSTKRIQGFYRYKSWP